MNEPDKFALVPRPPGVLETTESGRKRILSGMVADALELGRKTASKEVGVTDSQLENWYRTGEKYYFGWGVPKDYAEAAKWFRKAAETGHKLAQTSLGVCCEKGGHGLPKDYAQAVKWYRRAAEQGHLAAQMSLGACYANGRAAIDIENAVDVYKWVKLAEDHGYEVAAKTAAVIEELLSLEEFREAERRYREFRLQNSSDAETSPGVADADLEGWFQKGETNYYGIGVPRDYAEAVAWFRKAAEQGHTGAQRFLGWCYDYGHGVSLDHEQAIDWYCKAEEQGNADAQIDLSRGYDGDNPPPQFQKNEP